MSAAPSVIAISCASGAGKSALAARTAGLLGDAVRLNADDYGRGTTSC